VEKQRYLFRREKCFPTAAVRHVKEQPRIGRESETDAWRDLLELIEKLLATYTKEAG
jgi:hypothetical protein